MTLEELERKSETEGLTVEEVMEYQKLVKPVHHVYGKYGTLAKHYIEEHNFSKLLSLAGHLPDTCTELIKRRMISMTLCMKSCPKTSGISGRGIIWKTFAVGKKYTVLSKKKS